MAIQPMPFLFPDTEPADELHAASPTAHLLDELSLYGHRPGRDEPDPRPLPEADAVRAELGAIVDRSEEHTSELQSLMRISYAVFCLKKKKSTIRKLTTHHTRTHQLILTH